MNNNFEKQLKNWQNQRLTAAEKHSMLQNIFNRPIASPYARYLQVLVFVKRPMVMAFTLFLVFSGSVTYASQNALPGEKLYAVKTRVVEPIVDAFNTLPAQRLAREEAKVETRLAEAKALAAENNLDEVKVQEIERKIEKSSAKFVTVAEEISKKVATTTEKQVEKREELKKKFREKLRERVADRAEAKDTTVEVGATMQLKVLNIEQVDDQDERDAKLQRLKDRALKVLEEKEGESKN